MLPQLGLYRKINTNAGEPIDVYKELYDKIGKTYDMGEQVKDNLTLMMANLQSNEGDKPMLEQITKGVKSGLDAISKEAVETDRYDLVPMKIKALATNFITDKNLRTIQDNYATIKRDKDILNSPDSIKYVGGKNTDDFVSINPDGTHNTYKSDLQLRLDYTKAAREIIHRIKPELQHIIGNLSKEEQDKFINGGVGVLKLIERETLGDKQLDERMASIRNLIDSDPALAQYKQYFGGEEGVKKLMEDNFAIDKYSIDKTTINPNGFGATTDSGEKAAIANANYFEGVTATAEGGIKTFDELGKDLPTDTSSYIPKETVKYIDHGDKYAVVPSNFNSSAKNTIDDLMATGNKELLKFKKDGKIDYVGAANYINKNKETLADTKNYLFGSGKQFLITIPGVVESNSHLDLIGKGINSNMTDVHISGQGSKDKATLGEKVKKSNENFDFSKDYSSNFLGVVVGDTDDPDSIGYKYLLSNGHQSINVVKYDSRLHSSVKGYTLAKKNAIDIIEKHGDEVLKTPRKGDIQRVNIEGNNVSIQPIYGNLTKYEKYNEIRQSLGDAPIGEGLNLMYRITRKEGVSYLTPTEFENTIKNLVAGDQFIRSSFKKTEQ